MKTILILLFASCATQLFGQENAADAFKTKYKKQNFDRYGGKIERADATSIRYRDKVLTLNIDDPSLTNIFLKGILYPNLIVGKETTKLLTKSQLDKLSPNQEVFYNLSRNDSITISNVRELTKLNPNYKTKRFMFWLHRLGLANPVEYYFELHNDRATEDMSTEEFIENSRLTFLYKGTLII